MEAARWREHKLQEERTLGCQRGPRVAEPDLPSDPGQTAQKLEGPFQILRRGLRAKTRKET